MTLRLIAFSKRGEALGARLCELLRAGGHRCEGAVRSSYAAGALPALSQPVSAWVSQGFATCDGLIFIGAVGIAVREIAPFLHSKATDPAVVAIDELGRWAISLLSGHIGGANALAREAAQLIGAQAVVTTATDASGLFSVDDFAARAGLALEPLGAAKAVSAALLDGREVGFYSDFPIDGPLPPGLVPQSKGPLGIAVTLQRGWSPFGETLRLIPRPLTLGIGCRRNASAQEISAAVEQLLEQSGLSPLALQRVASIELKRDEAGLLAFCAARSLPLSFYSAEQLSELSGVFSHSERVERVAGVGCVCERAACALGGRLLCQKTSFGPVSVALAEGAFTLRFTEGEQP